MTRMTPKFVSIIVLLSIHGSDARLYDLFTPESRLSGFIIDKISPIGMVMCVRECSKRISCASLNYHRGRLECELSYSDATTNPSNMTSDSEFIYIKRNQIPQEYFEACNASCSKRESCVAASNELTCVKSDCPVNHPDTNSTGVKVTSTKIGTVLTYTCNSDTSITLTSKCRGDGTWTSSAFSCDEPLPDTPACFNTTTSCWYEYSFVHDTTWNGCTGGRKYVMKTKYTSAPIVGVELCNSTRYQIFLGANLTDTFLNIGHGSGEGADHCELVGGLEVNAVLPERNDSAPALTAAYARYTEGQEFIKLATGGATSWYSSPWYQCGVEIPGPVEPACMSATPPCWYAYNVSVDNSFNGCTGGQILVKRTNYTSAPFLAVQLCNTTRYKFFLGSGLGATFMNIGDGDGMGEDHCELVGGSENNAVPAEYKILLRVYGYYRDSAGQDFSYGVMGNRTTIYIHNYIQCGISIPGEDDVVYV